MKTFLRTSIFWILAMLAFLFVSGFGDIMTPLFSQHYLTRLVPAQVKEYFLSQGFFEGEEAGIATCNTAGGIEPIVVHTDGETDAMTLPAQLPDTFDQVDLTDIRLDIANLGATLNETMAAQFTKAVAEITARCQSTSVDSDEITAQRKAELQAQMELLQAELSNL